MSLPTAGLCCLGMKWEFGKLYDMCVGGVRVCVHMHACLRVCAC